MKKNWPCPILPELSNRLSKLAFLLLLSCKCSTITLTNRLLVIIIITNKRANFFAQDYFFLLLLEKSGLVTLLADVQMAKFDQNLTKIWSKFWSSPNFHLWLPNSDSPSKISFWGVAQRILVKVIVKYLQLFSNKNANFESLLLSSGKIGKGQFFSCICSTNISNFC